MNIRIGNGYDVHVLATGLELYLGGIKIEHTKGCIAHSDGDVLIHAICDALFGAVNKRDIGFHFPDTNKEFKKIDSKILLQKTAKILASEGWEIGNIDSTIVLQTPKIKALIPQMQTILAKTMQINPNNISIKATTTEKLGFAGREEGIAAYAVVLVHKKEHTL